MKNAFRIISWMSLVASMVIADGSELYKKGAALFKEAPEQALELFEQAADAGNVSAMVGAGHCYESGAGAPVDYAKALVLYEQAARLNSLKGCEGLARIRASCPDPKFHDGEKAVKFASVVAKKKPQDVDALILLSVAHARNFKFEKANVAISRAQSVGESDRISELKALRTGLKAGTPVPACASDEWILEALDRNCSIWAVLQMADQCSDKQSKFCDYEQAKKYYMSAGDRGLIIAWRKLGDLVFKCSDVNDLKLAIKCYKRAEQLGVNIGEERESRVEFYTSCFKYYGKSHINFVMETGKTVENDNIFRKLNREDGSESSSPQSADAFKAAQYYLMAYFLGHHEAKEDLSNAHHLLSKRAKGLFSKGGAKKAVEKQEKAIIILLDYADDVYLKEEYEEALRLYKSKS